MLVPYTGYIHEECDMALKALERRGYKVSFERRYLFARLPDGQQVVVPVEQLHVNAIPSNIN